MHNKKEYMVGEIFRFNEQTFQCVASETPYIRCKKCAMPHSRCCTVICDRTCRYDLRDVHFIRVTNPENGMLFRASDGVLYELIENECIHYMGDSLCTCYEIDQQAFGDILSNNFHWYQVKENKQETSNMEETQRHLELAVVRVNGDQVTFKIAEQTHRGNIFTPNGDKFKSNSGYTILSFSHPEIEEYNNMFMVRGHAYDEDDTTLTVSLLRFAKIMEAVTEYNETNGRGYEKSWPQDGDKYYAFDSSGCIGEYSYDHDCTDEVRREFGNFFRTREEAEAALDRVKKAMKG